MKNLNHLVYLTIFLLSFLMGTYVSAQQPEDPRLPERFNEIDSDPELVKSIRISVSQAPALCANDLAQTISDKNAHEHSPVVHLKDSYPNGRDADVVDAISNLVFSDDSVPLGHKFLLVESLGTVDSGFADPVLRDVHKYAGLLAERLTPSTKFDREAYARRAGIDMVSVIPGVATESPDRSLVVNSNARDFKIAVQKAIDLSGSRNLDDLFLDDESFALKE